MNTARVNWNISADVECPQCGVDNDFMNVDEWWTYCELGENVEKIEPPCEIECKNCRQTIVVVGSDY